MVLMHIIAISMQKLFPRMCFDSSPQQSQARKILSYSKNVILFISFFTNDGHIDYL